MISTLSPITVTGGTANATYTLPANTPAGTTYTIVASYSDASFFFGASNNKTQMPVPSLTVTQASTTTAMTSADQTAFFGSAAQNITLTASVTASTGAGTVGQGTVTFLLKNATNQFTASVNVVGGVASLTTGDLPGGTPVGTYTITATYNGGTDFSGSSSSTSGAPTLTVSPANTTISASNTSAFFGTPIKT